MISDNKLEHVFEDKDLGVLIDSELSFADNIYHPKYELQMGLSDSSVVRFLSWMKAQLKCYKTTFVRPHLEYAQAVWAPHSQKYVKMLENVQIRATKLVDGFENLDYPERLRKLNLPTLAFRRMRGDMIEVYKHFNKYDQSTISPSFLPKQRASRKHEFQLHERRARDARVYKINRFISDQLGRETISLVQWSMRKVSTCSRIVWMTHGMSTTKPHNHTTTASDKGLDLAHNL